MKPAIQGGGLNYLGKQKMVTAPKKWLSSPDHEPAELAYITEKEKDILIDLDLYGSLNGKPNRGPAGIMSLQGDMGSIGGGGSSGGGGGGGGGGAYQDRIQQIAAAQARAAAASRAAEQQAAAQRDMQATIAQAEKAKLAVEPTRPDAGFKQSVIDIGFQEALKKTEDARRREEEFKDTGDYDVFADTTLFSGPQVDIRDIKGEVTDPDSVSYNPLLKALDEPKVDEGFKRYVRQVQQPIAPTPKSGIGTTLKNIALGVLAPQLLAGTALAKPYNLYRQYQTAKRFIPKGVQETIRTAFTPNLKPRLTTETKRKTTPLVARDREGPRVRTVAEKVATGQGLESGAKLLGVQDTQKAELFKRKSVVEDILRKGSYQGRDLTSGQKNNLMNYIEQINKFLVPVQQGI